MFISDNIIHVSYVFSSANLIIIVILKVQSYMKNTLMQYHKFKQL